MILVDRSLHPKLNRGGERKMQSENRKTRRPLVKFDGIVEKGRGSLRAAIRIGNEGRRKPQQNQHPPSPPERQSHSKIPENAARPATCRSITVVKEHMYTLWDEKIRIAEHSRHRTMHHAQTKKRNPKAIHGDENSGKPWRTKRGNYDTHVAPVP